MPSSIVGADLVYGGKTTNFPMSDKLVEIMENAVARINRLGHGKCTKIGSMGTYNPNSVIRPGVPSEHAYYPPRAIDISYVEFGNYDINSLDRYSDPTGHLAVESCLRGAGFGVVLGYDYNSAHHDHWHCDYSVAFGFAGTSQRQFAKRCYDYLGYKGIESAQKDLGVYVDGALGPETLGALCKAVQTKYSDGAEVPDETPDVSGDAVVIVGSKTVTYTLANTSAWSPLRSLVDAISAECDVDLKIDTTQWPSIIIKKQEG